jgi:hypothetical protein
VGESKSTRRESDLAIPVREYLEAQGYTVRSEVNGCDITAVLDDELIVVELKKGFSTDLLIQATERQRIADTVYVALPAEGALAKSSRYDKRRRGIENLLKRLEIGLIVVHFPADPDAPPSVEVPLHPVREHKPRRAPKTRKAVLREIRARSADYNVGGSTGRKILTAYREQCVHIAVLLEKHGPLSPADLRTLGASDRAQNILFKNVYDWFERLERGVYGLRARTQEELEQDWPQITAHYRAKLPPPTEPTS